MSANTAALLNNIDRVEHFYFIRPLSNWFILGRPVWNVSILFAKNYTYIKVEP